MVASKRSSSGRDILEGNSSRARVFVYVCGRDREERENSSKQW